MQPPSVVGAVLSSPPSDLFRLLAVPVFAWAAYRDVATRRVPNETWIPLVALGALLLVADASRVVEMDAYRQQLFVVHVAVSLGLVGTLGYAFWRLGGFGGADAKAVMVLALLFPEFPTYFLPGEVLPLVRPPLGVFSLTILSNTVLIGFAYPLVLAARNAVHGHRSPIMFVGKSVPVPELATAYGSLLESPAGFTRSGLDLDALRMYLRWRGLTLTDLRRNPDAYRDPRTVPPPERRGEPGDGALADGPPVADGGQPVDRVDSGATDGETDPSTTDDGSDAMGATSESDTAENGVPSPDDQWGAAAFLADIEGDAYGTTPETLRGGLEVVATEEEVWLTPGIPFVVPMFVGLVAALLYGDLLYALLSLAGLVP